MIHVFCNERGAGKTKELISLANNKIVDTKGDSVFIDDDFKYVRQIDRRIRFISTSDYDKLDYEGFYGLLCGLISSNYDIENIYIDSILKIVSCNSKEMAYLFKKIECLANKFNINLYINLNYRDNEVPEFVKEYVA